jgi:hypothetical protein
MTRTYKRHGQLTIVKQSKVWKRFIVDCGSFWMCHDKDNDLYRVGHYYEGGYFHSLRWVSREQFIQYLRQVLSGLVVIKREPYVY